MTMKPNLYIQIQKAEEKASKSSDNSFVLPVKALTPPETDSHFRTKNKDPWRNLMKSRSKNGV